MNPWHVLLAHGSRDEEWAAPFRRLTEDVQEQLGPAVVRLAFLQLAEPALEQIVAEAAKTGARRIVVLPLFMAQGRHVTVDIERLVHNLSESYPTIELELLAPIGSDARFWDLVRELATAKLSRR